MSVFDAYIQEVADYIEGLRQQGRSVREFFCPSSADELIRGLPIRVGERASPGIVLRADSFVELGHPEQGSSAFVVWTDAPSLLYDGRITVIGPDIHECGGASLPFGQILMVGGKELTHDDHESLVHGQYIGDKIEGYMVKSSSQYMWSRVSKDVAGKGFCFEVLGRVLMAMYKSEIPKVERMEVAFVTSSRDDVRRLGGITAQIQKIGKEIVKEHWKIKGYDIECGLDCTICKDKPVCDDIRGVLAARRKREQEVEGRAERA